MVPMADADELLGRCEETLSAEERERMARFKFDRDRRRYAVAHAALRSILAGYLRVHPLNLRFSFGPTGKPRLASDDLAFNLSHSHEMALIAVTQTGEIGIDIEWVDPDFAFEDVAQRFFTSREVRALTSLPGHLQRQAFYKCWTSKEAYLKAKGTGLSGELDEVKIVTGPDGAVYVYGTVPEWTLVGLNSITGYEAALVVAGQAVKLGNYAWSPSLVRSS
jgi:4'-phosphopantetheinyl transferase